MVYFTVSDLLANLTERTIYELLNDETVNDVKKLKNGRYSYRAGWKSHDGKIYLFKSVVTVSVKPGTYALYLTYDEKIVYQEGKGDD